MSAVWELELPKEQKLVLLAIADHANDDGYCWPSMSRIAWKCGYEQKRTVSDIIRKLLASEVLVIVERAHGRTPTKYQIRPHRGARLPEFNPDDFQSDRGAENAPHENGGAPNPLTSMAQVIAENNRGAENAPQAPQVVDNQTVEVRSGAVEVRSSARRGAVATAPESYNHQQNLNARTRAGPAQGPARANASPTYGEDLVLKNRATLAGITPQLPDEPRDKFLRRLADAEGRAVMARAEQHRRDRELERDATQQPLDEAVA